MKWFTATALAILAVVSLSKCAGAGPWDIGDGFHSERKVMHRVQLHSVKHHRMVRHTALSVAVPLPRPRLGYPEITPQQGRALADYLLPIDRIEDAFAALGKGGQ